MKKIDLSSSEYTYIHIMIELLNNKQINDFPRSQLTECHEMWLMVNELS